MAKASWSYEFGPSRRPERLVGGFSCELDSAELNEWHEFIYVKQVFCDYLETSDLLEIFSSSNLQPLEGPTLAALVALHADQRRRNQELYEMGKAWYVALVARREKAREEAERAEEEKDKPNG